MTYGKNRVTRIMATSPIMISGMKVAGLFLYPTISTGNM